MSNTRDKVQEWLRYIYTNSVDFELCVLYYHNRIGEEVLDTCEGRKR